jgi:phosphonate C-P lyase system protein PhnG
MGVVGESSLVALANRVLLSLEVEVVRGPTISTLMVRVEEPSEQLPFDFSEVTVTEAEVCVQGHRGYAMLMGPCPEKALAAAVLDAAIELDDPLCQEIETALLETLALDQSVWEQRWAEVAPTLAKFENVTEHRY